MVSQFQHMAYLLSHSLGIMLIIFAMLLTTWDGLRPCLACGCYECGDRLNQVCDVWFAWKEQWEKQWEIDIWPMIWMGGLALSVLMLPWTCSMSRRNSEVCLHALNLLWLILAAVPLSWRPLQSRCADVGFGFALDYMGIATGRLCGINMCLLLLTVGRSSAWLEKFGTGYTEAISIHRVAGWWCVGQVCLHTAAFVSNYYLEGGWEYLGLKLLPVANGTRPNYRGMLNFHGAIGVVGSLVLAAFSLKHLRRRMYATFYNVHVLSAILFILFGSLHDLNILLFTLPACSYFIDRMCSWSSRGRPHRAQLASLTPEVVRMSFNFGISHQRPLAPGSRWVYIKVPEMSHEWHPFSITGPADVAVLHVKVAGDWSRLLCSMAQSRHAVEVAVDGPYGVAMTRCPGAAYSTNSVCTFLSRGRATLPSSLLLVAGGVGIVPFADLVGTGTASLRPWSSVTVVWTVRGATEYEALERSLHIKDVQDEKVKIQVYITGSSHTSESLHTNTTYESSTRDQPTSYLLGYGSAMQSWVVTASVPGLALYVTIHLQSIILEAEEPWHGGVFSWSLASHGCVLLLAYVALACLTLIFALPIFIMRRGGLLKRIQEMPCRFQVGAREIDQHLPSQSGMSNALNCFSISHGRPNIRDIVFHEGDQTMLLVRACGPRSMLDATRKAVGEAKSLGRKVALEIEQAEW